MSAPHLGWVTHVNDVITIMAFMVLDTNYVLDFVCFFIISSGFNRNTLFSLFATNAPKKKKS